ncbi:hypothetical protein BFJ67_g5195 [Fusarium oxysporum f. sp. cepae]|nr:hypothetical protein BFJ67_g5195 [Fusarium oxysporum f. sp. cepae]
MGVHDEDGERQLSEPPATREELISLLTKAFTALAKGTGNPLGTVALRIHTEGRPKHQIQIRSEVEERSMMRKNVVVIGARLATRIGLKESQTGQRRKFVLKRKRKQFHWPCETCPKVSSTSRLCIPSPWHSLPGPPELKGIQFPNWKILQYVSELPSLPRLNRLALRFQLMKESIVLNLLKRTQPGGLFIGPMRLDPGNFKPIFKFCSSPESNMQKLEVRGPIYQMGLEERGEVHFQRQPYDEDAECCAHLRRQGEGVRRPIHSHLDPQGFVDLLLVNSEFDSSQAHTF